MFVLFLCLESLTLGESRRSNGHRLWRLRLPGSPPPASYVLNTRDKPGGRISDNDAVCWTEKAKDRSFGCETLKYRGEVVWCEGTARIFFCGKFVCDFYTYFLFDSWQLQCITRSPWWTSPAGRPCTRPAWCQGPSLCGPGFAREAGTWQTRNVFSPRSSDHSPCPCCWRRRMCVSGCCLPFDTRKEENHNFKTTNFNK